MPLSKKTVRIKDEGIPFNDFALYKPFRSYCRSKHVKPKNIPPIRTVFKIIAAIFKEIREQLIERTGGVMIKGFGYFCVHVSQGHNITFVKKDDRIVPRKLSRDLGKNRITMLFLPNESDGLFKLWSMSHQYAEEIKNEVKTRIRGGKKYKIYPFTLRKMLGMSQYVDKPIGRSRKLQDA
jgi:hypothetical protein